MTAIASPTALAGVAVVCSGGSCRKGSFASDHKKLCAALGDAGTVVQFVGCLGVCAGPAVAIKIGDRIEIVEKARGKAMRRDIVTAATGTGEPSNKLRRRMLGGSARSKATRRLGRRLEKARRH